MNTGFFLAIDGPSGVGKSTVTAALARQLAGQGLPVLATREPTASPLGDLARFSTNHYQGITLACLVAADRYQHLETEIRPALATGAIVVCDRYVASSLVLQGLDGVPADFLWTLVAAADRPDLTVILTGDPARSRERAARRGLYSRFHHGGPEAGTAETEAYRTVAAELEAAGYAILVQDIGTQTAEEVTAALAASVLARLDGTRTAPS
ncbi:dTMP kinase [Frankia sp. CNm7]|uniref:Thymidylate kinase n=1 Tax=Frankia nepalensis TaxID=1836974 RepID=A0A937UUT2_9ACTN|nr:dTMP kinase [Frankia nepalensis]MBL7499786.1 dTMP kinase [Frankia nepalensis]MBL7512271.1 dTMP kinase [Frankia nepalensis]MBL7520444.1 dTMP kinase [Frankia nepalensis]MBL7632580.1 dTMP kinase [Frankia nepalensis]